MTIGLVYTNKQKPCLLKFVYAHSLYTYDQPAGATSVYIARQWRAIALHFYRHKWKFKDPKVVYIPFTSLYVVYTDRMLPMRVYVGTVSVSIT